MALKGRVVLLVEDDPEIAEVMTMNLAALGCKIFLAVDAIQGVMFAQQKSPDVILLDCMMPAGGGPSVYERIRENANTSCIPVLFLTAVPEDELREKVKMGPLTSYFQKPINRQQLEETLLKILG